jgi:hypothetical protein
MARPSFVLPLAGILLLGASGILVWNKVGSSTPSPGSNLPAAAEKSRSHPNSTSSAPAEIEAPATRSRPSEEKKEAERKDIEQINQWLADESVTPEAAAKNLWGLATDPSRTAPVRDEALTHALNLTDDETFGSIVLPLLSKKGLLSEDMGEKLLDDLYNRPDPLKLQGTLALFQNSSGELHTHVRELLVFELEDPDAQELSDAELIRRANERLKAQPEP